jgi:TRAP-type C4-dicarboxylate transport system permease small subunit
VSDTQALTEDPEGTIAALPRGQGSSVQRFVAGLDQISLVAIVAAMAGMTIIVTAQVFWRHVLNSSIDSADELSRLLFVWAMFLAIPQGIKYGVHVGIDLLISFLRPTLRELMFRLMAAASSALMIAVFMASWTATDEKWQQLMPTLPVTASIFYIAILISAIHSLLHLVLYAWGGSSIWGGRTL